MSQRGRKLCWRTFCGSHFRRSAVQHAGRRRPGATWLFGKARILAISDDLETVLLMIPLKMLMVGIAWQLGVSVVVMALLLIAAYVWLHRVPMPVTWRWVLLYASLIVGASELLYAWGKVIDPTVPIHVEILLPAFVVGCLARPRGELRGIDVAPSQVEEAASAAAERGLSNT